jgi:hypothetical protein
MIWSAENSPRSAEGFVDSQADKQFAGRESAAIAERPAQRIKALYDRFCDCEKLVAEVKRRPKRERVEDRTVNGTFASVLPISNN